ncbi:MULTISPECIES: imidazole glycerol phosphate synthase subunit HisF [unclassified Oceanispirochaeta]|uniref:imidazole glycerol phosphate synthase subunit HisF n=1 Tax=unclassified Oceanispirochaeta TaxID=2635722 RepID=UPI000E091040|nr:MULTISPECIES: imidazole glycerol phosphate synthase subunit HisF [unclassified Oceanispirochaeta]MBF9017793.1 imidazole glycerol phosphate synthase subunit HisF [Oceanispirochaeta sp. M2]NPD74357.1 imidazole glycerol phosphate synthase subunit HisF [Oceanispirochaeta sp. M1]RDG29836.1 imidazole glycerol phosphate synthase subunit HisF [Oceanispirochaeta sp. M1]
MLQKRIVVCLDVRDGKTTKGIKFKGNIDIGDPVEMAAMYYEQGVDELVFYDITASSEKRGIMIDVVSRVAKTIFIPFCVGGGISSLEDMKKVIGAGAEKVSLNSAAVRNPDIINQGARHFGNQCIVLGMDALADPAMPSGYRVVIDGGRKHTELDALAWAKDAEARGAGEIVLNSIDADGTREGYELTVTRLISENVGIPVVASGGAGEPSHLADVLTKGKADAALIASMVHFGDYSVPGIKDYLHKQNIPVRI